MNKRIRYSKVKPGVLLSLRNFTTDKGQVLSVYLDLNSKTYNIIDANSQELITSGGGTKNISVLKIKAKKGLMDLGVSFQEEVRNRNEQSEEVNQNF